MFSKLFLMVLFVLSGLQPKENSVYHKEYYQSGIIKEEGWLKNGVKANFWKFYHTNGKVAEKGYYKNNQRVSYWYFYDSYGKPLQEGHYKDGMKSNWWLFYDSMGKVSHKCQLSNGKKNGYCLKYVNEELISAEKYQNGKKIKEWFSFSSFRRENNLSDLK